MVHLSLIKAESLWQERFLQVETFDQSNKRYFIRPCIEFQIILANYTGRSFMMHLLQLSLKRLYRIGDFTNRCGRAEFWLFYLFGGIIDFSLSYINSNILLDQKTNLLTYGQSWIVVFLRLYLFLGVLSAIVARLKDAGYSKGWGRGYIVYNLFFLTLNTLIDPPLQSMQTVEGVTFFMLWIPLITPSAKSEQSSVEDLPGDFTQPSRFIYSRIRQGAGFRVSLRP